MKILVSSGKIPIILSKNPSSDQDNSENDDDDNVDVKVEIYKVSDRESISKDDERTEQQLNHEFVPNVLDEDESLVAEAEDKFKSKLTNEFTEAETECIEPKLLFVGTFLDNYEDILESIDKIVDENKEDVEGNEIKEKDSKSEGSRYEMRPVYNEETLADVKHEPPFASEVFQDLTMLAVCIIKIILTMLNMLLNVKKSSCASTRFPISEMSSQLMPIIQEKLLTVSDSIKMDLEEDVVVDQTASADKFMVL